MNKTDYYRFRAKTARDIYPTPFRMTEEQRERIVALGGHPSPSLTKSEAGKAILALRDRQRSQAIHRYGAIR